jgi:hypothetical protein
LDVIHDGGLLRSVRVSARVGNSGFGWSHGCSARLRGTSGSGFLPVLVISICFVSLFLFFLNASFTFLQAFGEDETFDSDDSKTFWANRNTILSVCRTWDTVVAQTRIDPERMGVEVCRFAAPRSCSEVLSVFCGRPRVLHSVVAKTLVSWASGDGVESDLRCTFLQWLSRLFNLPNNAASFIQFKQWFRKG